MGARRDPETSRADLECLYRSRLPQLRRTAAAICGDRSAAADVVQDTFVRAVRELPSFRGEGTLEAWVWRILVNTARNHRRGVRAAEELPDDLPAPANGNGPNEAGRVATAVAALPERQRLVLFLRFYADLDYRAIAEALAISSGTVGATLTAARSALEQSLLEKEATG
jgi:RNA polymerase sigma factor (sigma-70 family)